MVKNLKNIRKDLKSALDKDRYEHTLGVAYTAMCLAIKYEADIKKAEVAGLLHDCAKCMPDEKKLKKCIDHNLSITDTEKEQPYLLHAKVGAFIAMDKYGIDDMEIINAILKHTTGSRDMTLLEKIIYVADYIEPNRSKAANLPLVRKMAFEDIDLAVFTIMRDTVEYLKQKNRKIDSHTMNALEYYRDLIEKRGNS